ncbi:MAG: hypothetical protein IT281_11285, partial [Ignavibacteria bacterium]|nr:hypothetical protein [Ignavibacteria bacterium]
GSFFLNPIITNDQYKKIVEQEKIEITHYRTKDNQIKIPAGWIIEKCNWKGSYLRTAGTWNSHANVLINNGSNNGYDLWTLAKEIRTSVEKRFDIRLEPEVNVIRIFKPIKVRFIIDLN